jgi:hypothetical protein
MKTWLDLIRYMYNGEIKKMKSENSDICMLLTKTAYGWAYVRIRYNVGNNNFRTFVLTVYKYESLEKFYRKNKNAELIFTDYNSNTKRVKFPDELEYEMFKAS